MATHLAAVSPAKGQLFELQTRLTPKPGPDELLIAVKSVALNPADAYMRDQGLFIPTYPTVIGFDMSGLVLEVGDNVPTSATDNDPAPSFRPGITRVAAYAASVWKSCDPDYGAFQERCLVPGSMLCPFRTRVCLGTTRQACPLPPRYPLMRGMSWGSPGWEKPLLLLQPLLALPVPIPTERSKKITWKKEKLS